MTKKLLTVLVLAVFFCGAAAVSGSNDAVACGASEKSVSQESHSE